MRHAICLAIALVIATPAARADTGFVAKISKVKVKGGHGGRAITKQLRTVGAELGACKASDPSIPTKRTIGIQIDADGSVTVLSPNAETEPGLCFGKALAQLTFPPQHGLTLATFVATFVPQKPSNVVVIGGCRGRDCGKPGPSHVTLAVDMTSTARSALRDHLDQLVSDVGSCNYNAGDPTKAGTITIGLRVEASGATTATLTKVAGVPQAVADCLDLSKRHFDFSALADDKAPPVDATLTFTFTPP